MSIKYIASQIKIPGSRGYGKWYAKMVSTGTVRTEQLAEELSHSSSVTRADIVAVLYALAVAIRSHLLQSEVVHLEGLGTLRVSLQSHTTETEESVGDNLIYNYKVVFLPEMSFNQIGPGPNGGRKGFYTKELISGANAKKMKK